ncbi:MAG: IclR family transcriptional regulator [Acidobacteriaceae bacterium]|nr:IclR family transcriptional regulator [Acidobacteriaceae bacterium]
MAVMEVLRDNPEGCELHKLARETGQVKSSIHRILHSLMHHGYVEQDNRGGSYRLGVQLLVLARGIRLTNNLVELARPYSRELMDVFDESTYIAILRHGRGVFVDVQETRRDLRLVGPLGAEVHFHATAAGKAMAAFFPKHRAEALLRDLRSVPLTRRTLLSRSHIEREWAGVRRSGYAVNDEETIQGAIFIAGPLFDSTGAICGSISIGLPKPRYSTQIGERIKAELKQACRRVTDVLEAAAYVHENAFPD